MYAVYAITCHDEFVDVSAILCIGACSACGGICSAGDLIAVASIIGNGECRRHFTQYGRREGDRQINSLIRAQCNRQVGLRQHERAATGVHDGADCKLAAAGIDYLYGLGAVSADGDVAEVPAVFAEGKFGGSHYVEVLYGLFVFHYHHGVAHRCITMFAGGDSLSSRGSKVEVIRAVLVGSSIEHRVFNGDEHIGHGMSVFCNDSGEASHVFHYHEESGISSVREKSSGGGSIACNAITLITQGTIKRRWSKICGSILCVSTLEKINDYIHQDVVRSVPNKWLCETMHIPARFRHECISLEDLFINSCLKRSSQCFLSSVFEPDAIVRHR